MEQITFASDGLMISADLYLPEHADSNNIPIIVQGGGWCYVKEIVQPSFAKEFNDRGMAALVFDYRYLGGSEGEPRQRINPWDQIEDYKNAISYAQQIAGIDPERVGVWGISYSGGHVLQLAAIDRRIKAASSVVPVINGYENLRLAHGTISFRELLKAIESDRSAQFSGEEPGYLNHNPQEPQGLSTWPFPTSADMFRELVLEGPNYVGRATTRSTEWLLEYNVRPYTDRIDRCATLMLLAEGDDHTHWDLALDAYHAIPCRDKRLEIIRKSSHQTIYKDKDRRNEAAALCADWFALHL